MAIHIDSGGWPMRSFFLCLLPLFFFSMPAKADVATLGLVLTTPEIAGIEASFWIDPTLTLDVRATLASVDAGVTGHIPLNLWRDTGTRHSLLITGMGGFAYGDHSYYGPHGSSFHWLGLVGYGLLHRSLDVRLQAGLSGARDAHNGWATGFAAQALIGKVF